MRHAVAYVRRSSGQESPASLEQQQASIATQASRRGEAVAEVFRDWGRSGADRSRAQFLRLVSDVEAGRVSTVYVYDSDRLGRRTATVAAFLDSCEDAGTAVVDGSGRDLADPDNRALAEVGAVMDADILRKMRRRNRANADRRRARGDAMGGVPYGHSRTWNGERFVDTPGPEAVAPLNAYAAAGSALGAANLLNAAGIPSAYGRAWQPASVHRYVTRFAPELLPPTDGRQKRQPRVTRVLSGLLRCPCGRTMTPNGPDNWCCPNGAAGVHPKPYCVASSRLMPWIMAEAARLRAPAEVLVAGDAYDDSADRGMVEAMRDAIGEDAYALAVANLDAKRAAHGERLQVVHEVPQRIDWDTDLVAEVNGVLRALWRSVQLGPDLLPVEADWKVPQWRR